jgi:hypothetical protein
MRKHINNLREQHPSVRARVALMAAASVTVLAAIVWVTTLPVRFADLASRNQAASSTSMAAVITSQGEAVQTDQETGLQVTNNPYATPGGQAAPQSTLPEESFPPAEYGNY